MPTRVASSARLLLPAFAGAFLGSTQIKPGRFNVLGTLVAMYMLAIGIKGLQLKYPQLPWIADLVEGLILLIAVSVAVRGRRRRAAQQVARRDRASLGVARAK
jgi:ribose transport system permease protein